MSCIVLKFGGTSVGTVARIRDVATLIRKYKTEYDDVIVVVSAMAGATNHLVTLLSEMTNGVDHTTPHHDVVLSTGEQVTTGLLTLALESSGINAQSFQGWQVPIITNGSARHARIINIEQESIKRALSNGVTPVISGFQGITDDGLITTLGRGGSDTTAVAVASFLKADCCHIFTDVNGVYSTDPRMVSEATCYDTIPLDIMYVMAKMGAKVMHDMSIEHALRTLTPIVVKNTFNPDFPGTIITGLSDQSKFKIYGLTHNPKETLLHYVGESDGKPFEISSLRAHLTDAIDPDSIQISEDTDIMIACANDENVLLKLNQFMGDVGFNLHIHHKTLTKISVVGSGISHNGFRNKVISFLEQNNISPGYVYFADLRLTLWLPQSETVRTLTRLHTFLDLDYKEVSHAHQS
jgi:aspartate kinase